MLKQTSNLTAEEYQTLRSKYDYYHAEWKRLFPGKNGITVEEQNQLPPSPSHDEISAIEVYEFRNDPPVKYFAYVYEKEESVTYSQTHVYKVPTFITTWTGEILGEIIEYSHSYKSNMGDTRVNIRIRAINGKNYSGIYYKSSGDYCRIKMVK